MNVKAVRNLFKCATFTNASVAFARPIHKVWTTQTSRALCSAANVHNEQRFRWAHSLAADTSRFTNAPRRTVWTSFACNGQSRPQMRPSEGDERQHTAVEGKQQQQQQPSGDEPKVAAAHQEPAEKSDEAKSEAVDKSTADEPERLTLTQRFKKMYKEYWYVLIPVHMVTACAWMGGFYYLSSSGVDIPAVLETLHFSEATITQLKDSSMGHLALAFMCYKLITPLRYAVTLGGTTVTIKYLSQWGYIKPVPNKAQLQKIYEDRKAKLQKKL